MRLKSYQNSIYFLILSVIGFTACKEQPPGNTSHTEYNDVDLGNSEILKVAFESRTARGFLIPRKTDTVYLLKNAFTAKAKIRSAYKKVYIVYPLKIMEEKKIEYYLIVDKIIWGNKYAAVSVFGNTSGHFTGLVRNVNGDIKFTEERLVYDAEKYPNMRKQGLAD